MERYSLNLIANKRRNQWRSIDGPFLLLVVWIVWVILPKDTGRDPIVATVIVIAFMLVIHIAAVPLRFYSRPDPLLVFIAEAIEECQLGFGFIPQKDILEVRPRFEIQRSRPFPTIDLRVSALRTYLFGVRVYLWLLFPLGTVRTGVISIPIDDLEGETVDAIDWIRSYHPDVRIVEPLKTAE
jgi:hypothetical protein